jgi:Fe-S cluster assembly protein SufD
MMLTKERCFEQLLLGKAIKSDEWLEKIRVDALQCASILQFPSATDDDWRFTDLSGLFCHAFQPVGSVPKLGLHDVEKFLIPRTVRLVFIDGCYAPGLSDLAMAGPGLMVSPLVESFGGDRPANPLAKSNLGRYAPYRQDAFVALNTNFFEDGALVRVGGEVATPVHVLHIASCRDLPAAIYPRCLVVLDPASRATLVEDYVALHDGPYLTTAVTEVLLGQHSHLSHVRVQREGKNAFHIGHCAVELGRGSHYASTSLAFGAGLSRYTQHVSQKEEGAEMHLNGLAWIAGHQVADTHTLINHGAPSGKSFQLHKCIAGESAHAIFSGKVIVDAGASGTDSAQSSRNLLLSDKASVDAQPQLEIFNDDVSCRHGATVGKIDADALFFLKSRGLAEETARSLLTHAFAAEIIERIPVSCLAESLGMMTADGMTRGRT